VPVWVVLFGALVIASCGREEGELSEEGDGSEVRSLDTTGGAPDEPEVEVVELSDPLGPVELEPGTYATTLTAVPVRFTVADGWFFGAQAPWELFLTREPWSPGVKTSPDSVNVVFLSEGTLPVDPLGGCTGGQPVGAPPPDGLDFVAWLDQIEGVEVAGLDAIGVAGRPARAFDIDVTGLPPGSECGGERMAIALATASVFHGLWEGIPTRNIVIGEGPDTIWITWEAIDMEFDRVASDVVDTLEFG
jgi:hypothetical protein